MLAEQALEYSKLLYQIDLQASELTPDQRRIMRNEYAKPIAEALHKWMLAQREKVPNGTGIARALD